MYSQIASNKRKTVIVLAVFLAFVALLDWLFGTYVGGSRASFYVILIASALYAAIMYYSGSRAALAVNGAKEIQKSDDTRLWNIIENQAITDGLPMPRVFI